MSFSSPFFIFCFFPLFLLLFFYFKKNSDSILLTGSLGFYLWSEPIFCIIAILSSLIDHFICRLIYANDRENIKTKFYMAIGIVINLAILIYYKYSIFFISNIIHWIPKIQHSTEFVNIILPIGVSFITFEKITYLVDTYRGKGKPAKNTMKYLTYVFLFPKLLAGPIVKYHEIEKQLHERLYLLADITEGFKRFIVGLIKKVLIADTCSEIANQAFSLSSTQLGFSYAWLGIFCFTLQVYFDFSAYSDMALGIARMLGFYLKENFNMPYISRSFTEFWQRWHISLSTWIREYLYIPLGGNRTSPKRRYFNLWICFLLVGLWHGANWTFVAWGIYNGLFLILDKLFWIKLSNKLPALIAAPITLLFLMIGLVIFRSHNFIQVHYYLKALIGLGSQTFSYIEVTPNILTAIIVGSLLSFSPLLPGYTGLSQRYLNWKWYPSINNLLFSIFGFFSLLKITAIGFNPFLYFKF
ncbi:MAG: MBOAT family O-acyltransferase [Pseudomonadota bacterium]